MKNFIYTAAALVAFAGMTIAPIQPMAVAQKTTPKKPGTSTSAIPPAHCPYNDPNGCGILD